MLGVPLELRWLIGQSTLRLRLIHDTEETFCTVQNSELADPSDFIQPPSIMLTLGLSLEEREGEFRIYAQAMKAAGVVAIGFGTGMKHDEVPDELVVAAREEGLGLFEIPEEISFISITTAAQEEQLRRLDTQRETIEREKTALSREAQERGLQAMLELCGRLTEGALAVVDSDGRVNANYDPHGWNPTAWAVHRVESTAGSGGHRGRGPAAHARSAHGCYWLSEHIPGVGDRFHVCTLGCAERPDERARSLLHHCVIIAGILLRRPEELHQARAELATMAIAVHLGRESRSRTAMTRIFREIADSSNRIRPVVLSCADPVTIERAIHAVSQNLRRQGRIPAMLRLDHTAVLLFLRGDRSLPDVDTICEGISGISPTLRGAVGRPTAIPDVTATAVDRLHAEARMAPPGTLVGPTEHSPSWLHAPALLEVLEERAQDIYGRLAAYDQAQGTELSRTLDCWATHGGVAQEVAKELGIHRQTVRARLTQIESLCEIDLSQPVTLAELVFMSTVAFPRGRRTGATGNSPEGQ